MVYNVRKTWHTDYSSFMGSRIQGMFILAGTSLFHFLSPLGSYSKVGY